MRVVAALGFCNDALGHEGANEVIKYFADNIKEAVDRWHKGSGAIYGKRSTAYRQGGDEFAVICFPKSRADLHGLTTKLAGISWSGVGTEATHAGVQCYSW